MRKIYVTLNLENMQRYQESTKKERNMILQI